MGGGQNMKTDMKTLMASLPDSIINHIQHLERIRQDFVANVSHELRTPLTVMHGYLEILLGQMTEEHPWQKIFLQMQQQTARMENLVENLLLLSRLESGVDNKTMKQPIAVAKMLLTISKEAEQLSGEALHTITLEADEQLLLRGIEQELHSLFSNIIFNAIKYTPAQGHIAIRWYYENNKAYFEVQDTGIGIAPKHLPRITERFYRVDKDRSRASGGTGLGLAIAKHVLIRHNGKLTVTSELGHGTTFTCIFPKKNLVRVKAIN